MNKLEMDKYIAKQVLAGKTALFRRTDQPFVWCYIEYDEEDCGCIEDPGNWEFWEENAEKDEDGVIHRFGTCTECEGGTRETGQIWVRAISHAGWETHAVLVDPEELTPTDGGFGA